MRTDERFALSAACRDSDVTPLEKFWSWFAERSAAHDFEVTPVPFARLTGWGFAPATGNLVHDTGRFFSIAGLRVHCTQRTPDAWLQPIIVQPEIGVLGMVVKEFGGVLHFLMQAKMEPGNEPLVQLSPTVQATRSNFSGVHGGRAIRHLDLFRPSGERRVLVDSLQSEQGSWFLRKRNRNMVVEATGAIEAGDDFCWLTLGQLHRLLAESCVINMDARSVLSTVPLHPVGDADAAVDVLSWLTETRADHSHEQRELPLDLVVGRGWRRTETEVAHEEGRFFRVIGVDVRAPSREVGSWSQPLIAPAEEGVVAGLMRTVGGAPQVLMQARVEAGSLVGAELAPTVQCQPSSYPPDARPYLLDEVLAAPADRIRYDAVHSEEGGRFYRALNRYLLVDAGDDLSGPAPEGFRWLAVGELGDLVRHSNYLNMEARSLYACLRTLT
ncbi:NDP-hexose 2,3-dehydratase family protein [Jidongwangia harbinensis]|uniref:NDP-hexose 2,3-dehydratase family protein n=1 Tax=Jidongwangia harbinensis TaxID=2878561 RepID=UPI001CDA1A4C|nr:NDP-hexose 2,3-dehydratase family protein [Jidongwangia harbinensis]MCA2217204.1 NDP-hexose 2,3-dehydratase family protein [Jidongwangia harbinensis]